MKKAYLVAGLGFGDEGKGTIVDSLTRKTGATLVVRYNGGAQAGHNVVTSDGREHCFSQFGSGTLAGARTHLSSYMMIDPLALYRETDHLIELGIDNPLSLLTISPFAPILTPYHRAMNQLRELSRGDNRHGSCGRGIGELGKDLANKEIVLQARDLWAKDTASSAIQTLTWTQERFCKEIPSLNLPDTPEIQEALDILGSPPIQWLKRVWKNQDPLILTEKFRDDVIIFEGAQGVLLDEWHGFHPYTTWSNTTFENAFALLESSSWDGLAIKIGVTRCYMTRHGAGPLPSEVEYAKHSISEHNIKDKWQGNFRCGQLDVPLLEYALRVLGGVDFLAVTCLDHLTLTKSPIVNGYSDTISMQNFVIPVNTDHNLVKQELITKYLMDKSGDSFGLWYLEGGTKEVLCETLQYMLETKIGILSSGPTAEDKEYLYEL